MLVFLIFNRKQQRNAVQKNPQQTNDKLNTLYQIYLIKQNNWKKCEIKIRL